MRAVDGRMSADVPAGNLHVQLLPPHISRPWSARVQSEQLHFRHRFLQLHCTVLQVRKI